MHRKAFAALAASLLLGLGAAGARALPPTGTDPCDLNPLLCEEPPVADPCDLDPLSCEPPPPVDPCDLDPASCEPPPVDPCDLAPTLPQCTGEEPPVDPGPAFPHSASMTGSAKVRGGGARASDLYALTLNFGDTTFMAVDGDGHVYTGNLVAKGAQGNKFKLFLDQTSSDAFAADVAARAATAAGRSAGSVLGDSSKLTLRIRDDGSVSLKIKSEMLVDGMGEVTFKANLASAPAPAAP